MISDCVNREYAEMAAMHVHASEKAKDAVEALLLAVKETDLITDEMALWSAIADVAEIAESISKAAYHADVAHKELADD